MPKEQVLEHNAQYIREYFSGITNLNEAAGAVIANLKRLRKVKHRDGGLMYPLLDSDLFFDNLCRLFVVVNHGGAETIPEANKKGCVNKGAICEACGNLYFVDGKFHCDLDRRDSQYFVG